MGVSSPPRRTTLPRVVRLGGGRLGLSEPVTVLRLVFMTCLGSVRGPIFYCLLLSSGPFYDLFKSAIA